MKLIIIFFANVILSFITNSLFCQSINAVPIINLCEDLKETSGLTVINNQFFTINDSGNSPDIYIIDTITGCWSRKIHVSNTLNADWEALTVDDQFLYIGDFGNNAGNRTDLKILKIELDSIALKDTVTASIISFNYAQQVDFTSSPNNTPFDCEAFISQGDSLYLFSKDWTTNQSTIYSISKIAGNYSLNPQLIISTNGKVTDAFWDGIDLKIIGYTNIPFCQFYENVNDLYAINTQSPEIVSVYFSGSPQMEGICMLMGDLYYSAEEFNYSTIHFPATFGRMEFSSTSINEKPFYVSIQNTENYLIIKSSEIIKTATIYTIAGQKKSVNNLHQSNFVLENTIKAGFINLETENGIFYSKRF